MKVLFITSAYPTHRDDARGIFIHRLARSIAQEGIQVAVIAPGAPSAASREQLDGVEVYRAKYWISKWQRLANDLSGITPNVRQKPWLVLQIPPLIAALTWQAVRLSRSFDLVHAHWLYPAGIAGLITAKFTNIPLIVTSHGGDLNLARGSPFLEFLSRQISGASNGCIGVSRDLCERFLSFGVPSKNITFIPYGVDMQEPANLCVRDNIPELELFRRFDGFRLLYIGSLNKRKSVETLVDACAELEKTGHSLMCVVIGSGPTKHILQEKVKANCLQSVIFVNPISPSYVLSWMSIAHALVLPSVSEGRPVVVLEAMATGLPVIATDIPGTRELVKNMETGLLFEPGNTEQLAECIEKLIQDEPLRNKMTIQARSYITSSGLTTTQIARQHIDIYERLIALRKR